MKNVQLLTRKSRDKGELPAVMVKKSASRAENMADAIKFARCVQTGGHLEAEAVQCWENLEKSADSDTLRRSRRFFALACTGHIAAQGRQKGSFCLHP